MHELRRKTGTISSVDALEFGSVPAHIELDGLNCQRPVPTTTLPIAPAFNGRTTTGGASADGDAGAGIAGAARTAHGKAGPCSGLPGTSGSALAFAVPGSTPVEIGRSPLHAFTGDDGGLIEGSRRCEAEAPVGRHCQERRVTRRTGMPSHTPLAWSMNPVETVTAGAGRD